MDSTFKWFFLLALVVMGLTVLGRMAVYNECKEEGGKGCLRKTMNNGHQIYMDDDK